MQDTTLERFLTKLDICVGVVIDGYFTYSYGDLKKSKFFEIYANNTVYKFLYDDNINAEVFNRHDGKFAFIKLKDIHKGSHTVSLLTYMPI